MIDTVNCGPIAPTVVAGAAVSSTGHNGRTTA
jgi:hypothetical protein